MRDTSYSDSAWIGVFSTLFALEMAVAGLVSSSITRLRFCNPCCSFQICRKSELEFKTLVIVPTVAFLKNID